MTGKLSKAISGTAARRQGVPALRGDARRPSLAFARIVGALCLAVMLAGARSDDLGDSGEAGEHQSLAGRLLVAAKSMPDKRFRESVIYMVRHGPDGAFGLIINKPFAEAPIAKLFQEPDTLGEGYQQELRIHYGGPVEPSQGFVLHSPEFAMEGTMLVQDGLAVTSNLEVLDAIAEGKGPKRLLVMFGYSGWGPGQLDGEIKRGDWLAIPADATLVFDEDYDNKWLRAIRQRGVDL